MQQIKTLVAAITFILAVSSCTKETNSNPAGASTAPKQLVYSKDSYGGEINYEYDTKGRLVKIIQSDRVQEFTYTSGTSFEVKVISLPGGNLDEVYTCTQNEKGYVTQLVKKNAAGQVTYTYNYFYDESGNMTRLKGYTPSLQSSYESVFEMENAVVAVQKNYSNGLLTSTTSYVYDKTREIKGLSSLGGYYYSPTLFGTPMKYAITDQKRVESNGQLLYHYAKAIQTTADGYPVKLIMTDLVNSSSSFQVDYTFK